MAAGRFQAWLSEAVGMGLRAGLAIWSATGLAKLAPDCFGSDHVLAWERRCIVLVHIRHHGLRRLVWLTIFKTLLMRKSLSFSLWVVIVRGVIDHVMLIFTLLVTAQIILEGWLPLWLRRERRLAAHPVVLDVLIF
jgi:hypothetical protein